jgi:uncharacterized linocin/CFP29 family protein
VGEINSKLESDLTMCRKHL